MTEEAVSGMGECRMAEAFIVQLVKNHLTAARAGCSRGCRMGETVESLPVESL